jgi:hypothetical protein
VLSKASWATLSRIKNGFNYVVRCSMAYEDYIFNILLQHLSCHEFLFAGNTILCICANIYGFEYVLFILSCWEYTLFIPCRSKYIVQMGPSKVLKISLSGVLASKHKYS